MDSAPLWRQVTLGSGGSEQARGCMGRLLKYAFALALAVGVGCYVVLGPLGLEDLVPMPADRNAAVIPVGRTPPASPASIDEEVDYMVAERLASLAGWRAFLDAHPSGAYAQSARAEVARRLDASAATPGADPTDNGRGYGVSERLASLGSYAQFATAKVEQLLLADEAPASGNPPISAQAPADERGASQPANAVSSAAEGAVPATAAVSHDTSQDAKPAADAEGSSAPLARIDGAVGTQLAALAPDEICQRDEEHLAQLRGAPSLEEVARFANELGCEKLRPQVLSLMDSLAPTPAQDASTATPPGAQVESGTADPTSSPAGADVVSPSPEEPCKRDEERLARLGSNPSGDEALRFVKELGCEKLLPQLQRLLHSLDFDASAPRAPADSARSNPLLGQTCASERAALDRLRQEPSAEAAGLFWRDLQCEGLRPQVRLLMESLNVATDSVGSAVAPGEPKARAAPSDAPIAVGADSAACQQETAELNRVRATPDLSDAKRFANGVTCGALKPQVARLLESLGE
jgi:hypothetical protein